MRSLSILFIPRTEKRRFFFLDSSFLRIMDIIFIVQVISSLYSTIIGLLYVPFSWIVLPEGGAISSPSLSFLSQPSMPVYGVRSPSPPPGGRLLRWQWYWYSSTSVNTPTYDPDEIREVMIPHRLLSRAVRPKKRWRNVSCSLSELCVFHYRGTEGQRYLCQQWCSFRYRQAATVSFISLCVTSRENNL